MGKIRILKKSVRFTVRSKRRFIVFMLIFAIVSSFIAFFVDNIDTLQTDEYLEQKGLVLNQQNDMTVTYDQGKALLDEILKIQNNGASAVDVHMMSNYAELDETLNIFSIDVTKPWLSKDINPSYIKQGRFPSNPNEVVIPINSYQSRTSTDGRTMDTDIVVGQTLKFTNAEEVVELKVVGTFEPVDIQIDYIDTIGELWFFMDTTAFAKLLNLYDLTLSDAYTYAMSFVVPGLILVDSTYQAIDNLNAEIEKIIAEGTIEAYGDWQKQAEQLPLQQAVDTATTILVSLGFAVIGGVVLSIMFSYLITRFRRREIAVLKALGYSNSSVRTSLVGEILTISIIGFFVGLISVQGILFSRSNYDFDSLLRSISFLASFAINVLITLPGMLLVSRRILKVSPAEAFRD